MPLSKVNDRSQFKRLIDAVDAGAYAILAALATAAGAALYGLALLTTP